MGLIDFYSKNKNIIYRSFKKCHFSPSADVKPMPNAQVHAMQCNAMQCNAMQCNAMQVVFNEQQVIFL
jgi:hypothetical protein